MNKYPAPRTDFYAESDMSQFHPGFEACAKCGDDTDIIDSDGEGARCESCVDLCAGPDCQNDAEPDNGHMGIYQGLCYGCARSEHADMAGM